MTIASDQSRRIPPSTLPLRLQLAREWRGYTQDELAEVLDVSRATVSNYERGVGVKGISRLQVNAWAAFCDVDVEWLKTGSETPEFSPGGGTKGQTMDYGSVVPIGSRSTIAA
jgi:transcriptional regulator with XRE-family HTH domain